MKRNKKTQALVRVRDKEVESSFNIQINKKR